MNNDNSNIPNYEQTVRSNENLRDKMEGILNEPNRFRSMENEQRDNEKLSNNNPMQSID